MCVCPAVCIRCHQAVSACTQAHGCVLWIVSGNGQTNAPIMDSSLHLQRPDVLVLDGRDQRLLLLSGQAPAAGRHTHARRCAAAVVPLLVAVLRVIRPNSQPLHSELLPAIIEHGSKSRFGSSGTRTRSSEPHHAAIPFSSKSSCTSSDDKLFRLPKKPCP